MMVKLTEDPKELGGDPCRVFRFIYFLVLLASVAVSEEKSYPEDRGKEAQNVPSKPRKK